MGEKAGVRERERREGGWCKENTRERRPKRAQRTATAPPPAERRFRLALPTASSRTCVAALPAVPGASRPSAKEARQLYFSGVFLALLFVFVFLRFCFSSCFLFFLKVASRSFPFEGFLRKGHDTLCSLSAKSDVRRRGR